MTNVVKNTPVLASVSIRNGLTEEPITDDPEKLKEMLYALRASFDEALAALLKISARRNREAAA